MVLVVGSNIDGGCCASKRYPWAPDFYDFSGPMMRNLESEFPGKFLCDLDDMFPDYY
jgi:hypothetical protein